MLSSIGVYANIVVIIGVNSTLYLLQYYKKKKKKLNKYVQLKYLNILETR